jgi:hypothetical protein
MAPAMISPSQKALGLIILVCGLTSSGRAQSAYFEVASTPYDRQMERVQPTLVAPSIYSLYGPSLAAVNQRMIELRGMPYRYSREWKTPFEVELAQVGDCKGKALVLYDWMQSNGATNLHLVIGKRRGTDSQTHAWLEWQTKIGTLLLDPTFNWNAAMKLRNRQTYIAYYEYEGGHKYQTGYSALANRAITTNRAPAAPAHGAISRPMRAASRLRSSSWMWDEGQIDPRFFANRPSL